MKVFVVLGGWNYEGYDKPVGVYSTLERAEAAKSAAYSGYDYVHITEYEIDVTSYDPLA